MGVVKYQTKDELKKIGSQILKMIFTELEIVAKLDHCEGTTNSLTSLAQVILQLLQGVVSRCFSESSKMHLSQF